MSRRRRSSRPMQHVENGSFLAILTLTGLVAWSGLTQGNPLGWLLGILALVVFVPTMLAWLRW